MKDLEKFFVDAQPVALRSERVDLALTQDMDKTVAQLLAVQRKLDKSLPMLEKLTIEVRESKATLKTKIGEADELLAKAKGAASELGVNPEEVKGYKALNIESYNSKEYLK